MTVTGQDRNGVEVNFRELLTVILCVISTDETFTSPLEKLERPCAILHIQHRFHRVFLRA